VAAVDPPPPGRPPARPGGSRSWRQLAAVLQMTQELAQCEWHDPLPPTAGAGVAAAPGSLPMAPEPPQECATAAAADFALLEAMRVRRRYGGMRCDMIMLDRYVQLWERRLGGGGAGRAAAGGPPPPPPPPPLPADGSAQEVSWRAFIRHCYQQPADESVQV
jgi:hypothetical protein